jgi:hypothetical protein
MPVGASFCLMEKCLKYQLGIVPDSVDGTNQAGRIKADTGNKFGTEE